MYLCVKVKLVSILYFVTVIGVQVPQEFKSCKKKKNIAPTIISFFPQTAFPKMSLDFGLTFAVLLYFNAFYFGVYATLLVVLALDDWLGMLAFRTQYAAFCLTAAALIALAWRGRSRRAATVAGVAVLALLLSPYVVRAPSAPRSTWVK